MLPCQKLPIDYIILLFLTSKTNITKHYIEAWGKKTNNTLNIIKVCVYVCLLIRLEKNLYPCPVISNFFTNPSHAVWSQEPRLVFQITGKSLNILRSCLAGSKDMMGLLEK